MKLPVLAACIFALSSTAHATVLNSEDIQLCVNAYNDLWFTFESAKAKYPGNTTKQSEIFNAEFPKVVSSDFQFSLINLPLPPDYNTHTSFTVTGVDNLISTAVAIGNYGEHHVATPFSAVVTSHNPLQLNTKKYDLTTRDVDYTRDPIGGCVVYLSQKKMGCTVKNVSLISKERQATLNSIVDDVVTSYVINDNPNQCTSWIAAPIATVP